MRAPQVAAATRNRAALLPSLDLEQTVAAYLNGQANHDNVASAYYQSNRVNRLVAHACLKYRSSIPVDFAQELKQELALLLSQKFLKTVDNPASIYNVLHVSACFIARRRAQKIREESLEELMGSSESILDLGNEDPVQELDDRIDHRRAVEEFKRRALMEPKPTPDKPMQVLEVLLARISEDPAHGVAQVEPPADLEPEAARLTPISIPFTSRARVGEAPVTLDTPLRIYYDLHNVVVMERGRLPGKPPKEKKAPLGPTDESRELKAIQEQMRLPVVEFGRLLGLKKPIIIGYLYGRLSVPDSVLDDARLLRLNQGSAVRELRGRFEGQPMDRIIDGWMELLGLQTAGRAKVPLDAKLAELLGVSRVTVWRWRRQIIRPELRDIDAFDRVVRVHAAGEQASERI